MPIDAPKNKFADFFTGEINRPLPEFVNLAPLQMLSFDETCSILCRSRSWLYTQIESDPTFPVPIKDGNARMARTFFVAEEIAVWQRRQLAARPAASVGAE